MRVAGIYNWWSPRPLVKLHDRLGLREGAPPEPVAPTPVSQESRS
jgi:RND superfamily putative drug exporter